MGSNGNDAVHADFPTIWQLLALPDDQLEQVDLAVLNLAIARGFDGLESLDVAKYLRVIDDWTSAFVRELPRVEQRFHAAPHKWKNDIRLYRMGAVQAFIGQNLGLRYIEEQKYVKSIRYTDPGQLFLHGLIDSKQGTCGNMPVLHVTICRRMGWPVSLAVVRSHHISRYDDGEVVHNIEATATHQGAFASDPDEYYIEKFNLPRRAIECGSELRKLTAREMIAAFLALRARVYCDTQRRLLADTDFALARALFPNHRRAYIAAIHPLLDRGALIFDPDEVGHPNSIFEDLVPPFGANQWVVFAVPRQVRNTERHAVQNRDMHVVSITDLASTKGKE